MIAAMFLADQGPPRMPNALGLEDNFRQPEIENLCLISFRSENVRGLNIPMDDVFRVCGAKPQFGGFNSCGRHLREL